MTAATGGSPPNGPGGPNGPGSGGSGAGTGAGNGTGPPNGGNRRRADRLILRTAAVLIALIGLAQVVAGIYPAAWLAGVTGPLTLAGLFAAGGVTALVTGRRREAHR